MSPQPNTEPRGGAQPALQTPGRTPENSFRGNGSLSGEAGRSDPCELMTQSGDTAADSFLEVLQRRLIETDAALADSEEQLNASRTNEKLLLQENQELRQILLALETAPVEHGAAARQNDRAHPEGFTYVADFSASSLPAKVRSHYLTARWPSFERHCVRTRSEQLPCPSCLFVPAAAGESPRPRWRP